MTHAHGRGDQMPTMVKVKINLAKCKKLTFRRDLCSPEAIGYFSGKDKFSVDTSRVFYDFKNTEMYFAQSIAGKKGYVAKEGVEPIVIKTRKQHPPYNPKNAGR